LTKRKPKIKSCYPKLLFNQTTTSLEAHDQIKLQRCELGTEPVFNNSKTEALKGTVAKSSRHKALSSQVLARKAKAIFRYNPY